MPKEKPNNTVLKFVEEHEDFEIEDGVLFCIYCKKQVSSSRTFLIKQHLKTAGHIAKKKLQQSRESQLEDPSLITTDASQSSTMKHPSTNETTISNDQPSTSKCTGVPDDQLGSTELLTNHSNPPISRKKSFNEELCNMFVSADIPLHKLNNPIVKKFLAKHSGNVIPDQTTMRKYYLSEIYREKISALRRKVSTHKIWVSVDETTDAEQRYIACFVFGILGEEAERDKCYLANIAILSSVNHASIAGFFNDSLQVLWPSQIKYENVLLVCTDAAPYMIKSMNGLQVLFPIMIHITCLAHGLHRVAELVRFSYAEVKRLISASKSIFVKAPLRVEKLKKLAPNTPLPPTPIITRWGTWIQAVQYYAKHFEEIYQVFMSFDGEDSRSVKECQDLLQNVQLKTGLVFISSTFSIITSTIAKLETRGLPISTVFQLMDSVEQTLKNTSDQSYHQKLTSVLTKNKGYERLRKINAIMSGQPIEGLEEFLSGLAPSDISCYQFAPLVSCDVERVFSQYKTILADNRRRFTFENLKYHEETHNSPNKQHTSTMYDMLHSTPCHTSTMYDIP
ncbi:uncharacterized protein LOC143026958 [Oratosquilla oratoria]|uniref:uncharacterized protein LOC143026958 n=1 Tax=Oratosquilla oratoria TaxID=337810 RepID=UPI003F76A272